MATRRKRWWKVADAVGSKPISNDVAAMFLRLGSHLNSRWSRDGLTREQACLAVVTYGQLLSLTGSRHLVRAKFIASSWADHFDGTFEEHGENWLLTWPNFAEFQGSESETRALERHKEAPKSPPPISDLRSPSPVSDPPEATAAKPAAARMASDHPDTRTDPTAWATMFRRKDALRGEDADAWVASVLVRAESMAQGQPGSSQWIDSLREVLWTFHHERWREDRGRLEAEQRARERGPKRKGGAASIATILGRT